MPSDGSTLAVAMTSSGIWVEIRTKSDSSGSPCEKRFVEPHFGVYRVIGRDPVNGGLDLAAIGSVSAAGGGIVGAVDFDDVADRP